MATPPRIVVITVLLWIVGFSHAALTWPGGAVVAFFVGGACLTFAAEAVGIDLGLLEHHVTPKVVGVPLYLLFAWTGAIYLPFRLALLALDGAAAALLAAAIATGYDVLTDHRGVAEGYWSYTDGLPGPRFKGVPWWNYAAWFVLSFLTSLLAVPFL
jgi:hypothetical protein